MAAEPRPPLLGRKKLVGLTEEATSGTAATVTAAVAANFYDIKAEAGDFFAEGKRQPQGNYMGSVASIAGKQMGTIEYTMEVLATGPFLIYLTGAGYKLTTGTWAPSSDMTTRKTWTVVVWEDGRRKSIRGAACKITLEGSNGAKLTAKFSWSGVWITPIDEAMPARAPIQTTPYMSRGMTVTMAAANIANCSKYSIDLGPNVEERQSLTDSTGIVHYMVTDIDPKIMLDPEARKVADMDAYGLMLAGTTVALVLAVTDGTNTLTITAAAAQRQKVTEGDRDKKMTDAVELLCAVSSGDDSLTLAETSS